jgi:hypothetical protein
MARAVLMGGIGAGWRAGEEHGNLDLKKGFINANRRMCKYPGLY